MKKSILILSTIIGFTAGSTLFVSCGSKQHHNEDSIEQQETDVSHDHDELAEAYACPMHPEVTGKKGDKCSKCKMDLTLVETSDQVEDNQE